MGQPGRSHVRSPAPESIGCLEVSGGTETSKYPEEKTSTEIPRVVVSERGAAQTRCVPKPAGVAHGGLEDPEEIPAGVSRVEELGA